MNRNTDTQTSNINHEEFRHYLRTNGLPTDILVPVGEEGPSAETVAWATKYAEAHTDVQPPSSADVDAVVAALVSIKTHHLGRVLRKIDESLDRWHFEKVHLDITGEKLTLVVRDQYDYIGEFDWGFGETITNDVTDALRGPYGGHLEVDVKEAPAGS